MTLDPTGGIFLSYRREEAGYAAGRLADNLATRFVNTRVFIDVDSIPPGEDFVEAVRQAVAQCDVLLSLIGRQWTTMTDDGGHRRLENPDDFVVLEIKEALDRDIPVVPVLVDGAEMPKPDELPANLRSLSRRNAVRVDVESFRRDVDDLLNHLARLMPSGADAGMPTGLRETDVPSPRPGVATQSPGLRETHKDRTRSWQVSRRTLLRTAIGVVGLSVAGAGSWAGVKILDRPLRPRWIFTTAGEVYSSPTVLDATLYVGSRDHNLYAVDVSTGSERWRYPTGDAITSSPAVAGGHVYVGSNDTRIHAVEVDSGRAVWTFPTGAAIHSSPAVVDGTVFIGSRDNYVYALDAATGDLRWRFAGGPNEGLVTGFNSSPVLADGVVYIGCRDNNIYAIDAAQGFQRWRRTTGSTVDSSGAVAPGMLLIGSDDQSLWAVSTADGAIIWTFPTRGGIVSRPRVQGDVVFFGSGDGYIYAVDVTTGRQRWKLATGGAIRSSPTSGSGLVYIGSSDFRLYAVDAMTGVMQWSFGTYGPVDDSSPVLVGDTVYFGSLDHRVYALDARRGAEENEPL